MKIYYKYLKYVLRHKWYVMIECFREGLIWRGLMHDFSKFFPTEFIPYANFFYGEKESNIEKDRNKTDYYNQTDIRDMAFDFAWLLHQKRNRHHWQWWLLPEDGGGVKILEMQEPFFTEMICDWVGAGKAQGHFSPNDDRYFETIKWYQENGNKMQLHQKTRERIESIFKLKKPGK